MKTLFQTLITLAAFMNCLIWIAFAWDIAMCLFDDRWQPVLEVTEHVYAPHWRHVILATTISVLSLLLAGLSYKGMERTS